MLEQVSNYTCFSYEINTLLTAFPYKRAEAKRYRVSAKKTRPLLLQDTRDLFFFGLSMYIFTKKAREMRGDFFVVYTNQKLSVFNQNN